MHTKPMQAKRTDVPGTIYLLHFSKPFHHAKHYLGWTENLTSRLKRHKSGQGSSLMAAVVSAGIEYKLAATWPGTRNDERKMKNRKNTPKLCPVCKQTH